MTFFRPIAYVAVAAAVLSFLPGCAAHDTSEDTDSSADELTSSSLRDVTIVSGAVAEGAEVTVAYQPDPYTTTKRVPFLAVELVAAPLSAEATSDIRTMGGENQPLSVSIDGNFPGSPRVLVVDQDFHVLAATSGVTTETGDHAIVTVPNTPGNKFILVRDMRWVLPMNFQVRAVR